MKIFSSTLQINLQKYFYPKISDKLKGKVQIMVGIIQKLVARYTVSMLQVNDQLSVVEMRLNQKGKQYINNLQKQDSGAVTAEYAVVLIAATGFAALLVAILKSDAIRKTLTELVKKALKIG